MLIEYKSHNVLIGKISLWIYERWKNSNNKSIANHICRKAEGKMGIM